jgi:hypothetical protein
MQGRRLGFVGGLGVAHVMGRGYVSFAWLFADGEDGGGGDQGVKMFWLISGRQQHWHVLDGIPADKVKTLTGVDTRITL